MADTNYIGNGTTLFNFVCTTIAGWIISLAIANGLDLGVDAVTLAQVIGAVLGLLYGYLNAKYPNTFQWLGNAPKPTINTEETVLNDEYECEDDGGC